MKKDFRRTAAIAAAALVIGSMLYAAPGDFIERERAMDIALRDSGLEASSVSFVRSHLDRDDGRMVYDVEFYSGNTEYDYEIDALTGEILAKDRDAEYWNGQGYTDALIEDSRAVSIALEDAGVADPGRIRAHLDRDDGRLVYEVEFRTADGEYEYRIDAVDMLRTQGTTRVTARTTIQIEKDESSDDDYKNACTQAAEPVDEP